jgi:signal peptidase II
VTVLLAAAAATAVVDTLTKHLVVVRLVEDRLYGIGASPGWGLRRVHNERGAFAGLPVAYTALLWMAMAALVIFAVRTSPTGPAPAIGLGAALGGAAGNLIDRIARRGVVDFVAAGPWPVFNLADAAMVVGLTLAAVSVL